MKASGLEQRTVQQATSSPEKALNAKAPAKARRRPDPLVLLALFLLMQIMVMRLATTYRVFNATVDESGHILAALELYQAGTYSLDVVHPPLARVMIGLLPYLSGVRAGPMTRKGAATLFGVREYWKTLTLARIGTLGFLPILIFYVYRWSSLLHGKIAGLAACALVTLSPNILGHAGLATTDFAATAMIFGAAYHFWRWTLNPSWPNCLLAAVLSGAAVVSKFSALLYLPAILVAFQLIALTQRRGGSAPHTRLPFPQGVAQAAAFCGLAWAVLWGVYSLHAYHAAPWVGAPRASKQLPPDGPTSKLARALLAVTKEAPVLPPAFTAGLVYLGETVQEGRDSYLLGAISRSGWWYYFPVVLAVKSTLAMLLLLGLAAAVLVIERDKELWRKSAYAAGAAAAILGLAMSGRFDIGVRHILPMYPFLAVFTSVVFSPLAASTRRGNLVMALGFVLMAWHGAESVLAHPDYVPYFNEIARGRELYFLGDSNLDWGQDLERLKNYAAAHAIGQIHLAYFGLTTPETLGMRNVMKMEPGERPTGWVAVSANYLQGINMEGMPKQSCEWLRDRQPYARIGKSIYLYYLAR